MMMLMSKGVLKPVGELKAFFGRACRSPIVSRSIGSLVGWKGALRVVAREVASSSRTVRSAPTSSGP
jgi:hypothetical protein